MSNNKRILVIGDINSMHLWRWCGFLTKLKFNVEILTYEDQYVDDIDYRAFAGLHDYSINKRYTGFIKKLLKEINFYRSVFFIRKRDYCYVNYHFIRKNEFISALLVNKKVILSCWGSDILIYYRNLKGYKKVLYDRALQKANIITYDGTAVKDTILAKCKGLDPGKFCFIHWGIDTELFDFVPAGEKIRLRNKFNIPQDAVVLFSPRHLSETYRIKEIIEWFRRTVTSEKIFLVIRITPYSNCGYTAACRKLAGSSRNIIFNDDRVSYRELTEFYKIADICLHFPSSDTLSVSIFEGLASGNLIFASESIEAYKILAETYNIKLTSLDRLDQDMILDAMKYRDEIISANRSKLIELHSEQVSLQQLKECLEKHQ